MKAIKKKPASLYSKKEKISKSEYFMLIGLLAVTAEHMKALDVIELSIGKILGEKPKYGHAGDAVYGKYSIDQLMDKTCLKVVKNAN